MTRLSYWILILLIILSSTSPLQNLQTQYWIPITPGTQTIISFVVGQKQMNQVLMPETQNYTLRYEGLPKWINIVDQATLVGVAQTGTTKFTVFYTNKENQFSQTIYLSDTQPEQFKTAAPNTLKKITFTKQITNENSFENQKNLKNMSSFSHITIVLPSFHTSLQLNSKNPILLSLQGPPQPLTSINYIQPNHNSYSQDSIRSLITQQQTSQNNYLQTILALSHARINLQSLNNSSQTLNKNLLTAYKFMNETKLQYSKHLKQQQQSQKQLKQTKQLLSQLQNQIKQEQQKLTNMNYLIATIQSQIVKADSLKTSFRGQKNQSETSLKAAQAKINAILQQISSSNVNITYQQKRIRESQNVLTLYSSTIYLTQVNLNSSISRLATAQQQLKLAKQAHFKSKTNYDNLVKQYKQAPETIKDSQNLIAQLRNDINGILKSKLQTAKTDLIRINQSHTNTQQYYKLIQNTAQTLKQQLKLAESNSINITKSIQNRQKDVLVINNNLNQMFSNKAISTSNVNTLKIQLGLAEQNYQKVLKEINNLKSKLDSETNAYKIAVSNLEIAQAVKSVSDQQLNKLLKVGLEQNIRKSSS